MLSIILGITILAETAAAFPPDHEIRGYLRNTTLIWKPTPTSNESSTTRWDNILTGRLNLRWFMASTSTLGIEWKNRAFYSESASESASSSSLFSQPAYFNWKKDIIDEKRWLVSTEIDRAWFDYQAGSLQLTVGRQRIAWGTNLVWNPLDLFNPASPLDFDNEEKPGGDALRVQYHLGVMTRLEFAIEAQREHSANWAGLLRSNWRDYDIYVIAGKQRNHPLAGVAWAGQWWGAGVRGECRVDFPRADLDNRRSQLTWASSLDYTFANGLYIHTETLVNSRGTTADAGGERYIPAWQEGWLTPAKASLFGEVSKDLHPLLRAGVAGILNPYDHSFYMGPNIFWSVFTNLDVAVAGMFYAGESSSEFGGNNDMQMIKLKWSF
ncbi:MAG: hypothetical protein V2A61_07235 [Calditrichota bacterium]